MAKSYYAYHDDEVRRIGSVTIVDGSLTLTEKAFNSLQDGFDDLIEKMEQVTQPTPITRFVVKGRELEEEQIGEYSNAYYTATSYSKCDPADTYNAKKGLIVASRKTEEKLNRRVLKDITALRQSLESLLGLVKDIEDRVDYKVGKLNLDLAVFNKETEAK